SPNFRGGLRVVAQPAEGQVEEPVALMLPGEMLLRLIREDAPGAQLIAVALVAERGKDLEALAAAKPATLGETGGIIGIAPEEQSLRADRPEPIHNPVLPRLLQHRPEAIPAVAVEWVR